MKGIAEKLYYGARYFGMRAAGYEWLFVLGHMRSGSSLLVHLLNSNPEILGYGETPIRYTGRRSFVKLHDHVRDQFEAHGEPPARHHRYVMDKILWHHIQSENLLRQVPVSIIVIVRSPEEALPSIMSLNIDEIQDEKEALKYYLKRLSRLRKIIAIYDSRVIFTTYDRLIMQTERTLSKISEYLALDEKLTPTYDTMWATGESGIGDTSENIKEGRVRSTKGTSYDVNLNMRFIVRARERYREFCSYCSGYEH